jgi:hypothetical protein
VNRIALHQSTLHPLDPIELVRLAAGAGIDSIGLRVAIPDGHQPDEVGQWWAKGIGSPVLHSLIPALLESRVTVLDVGRVRLGPELRVLDSRHAYIRVLEVGVRLGAQFVTARSVAGSTDDPVELFGVLAELAARYRVRPLVAVVPGSPIDTLQRAREVVAGTGGGVVLDVSPRRHTPAEVDELVVELGPAVGYVRVPADELLAGAAAPGLLATLPPQVAVAIGAPAAAGPEASATMEGDRVTRVRSLRDAVDAMLRHPSATR